MPSYQSGALQSAPGYAPRKSSTAAFTPNIPQIGALPTAPALANDASTPGYVGRNLISQQLGQLPGQQNAAFTGIQASAKQALTGYGGYSFQKDDPNTPQREDLLLNYDASKGMGERDKAAYKGAANQANAAGMYESSFAGQNIASAVQRVSLEAQQIANQYAQAINTTAEQYANRAADLTSQWAGLYGSDSAWLVQNPPPAPVVAAPTPAPEAPVPQVYDQAMAGNPNVAQPTSQAGSYPTWTGSKPPNLDSLAKQWGVPRSYIRVTPLANGKYTAYAQAAPNSGPRF